MYSSVKIIFSIYNRQSNPENTVGILTMAGKGVRVLATPTSDLGKILACMHGIYILNFLFTFVDCFDLMFLFRVRE